MHANLRWLWLFAALAAPGSIYGQTFVASLNGAQEVPVIGSTATGSVTVSVSGDQLTVNLTFSGLATPAIDATIHCCGPAGTNVAVAISLPGFPATTAGSYTQTLDLTNAATYTAAFVTASGGTAAGAEAALLAGLAAGNVYVNLHDAPFPSGEIRGQLAAPTATQDGFFQIGYAANLNIGDSVVNLSNDGANGGVFGATPATRGNICVNVYTFDPQEEEIACCSCLVTPNGLNSLSVKADLISNNLTPAVPTSVVVKLIASQPAPTPTFAYTVCNPAAITTTVIVGIGAIGPAATGLLATGMLAWGTTLEPSSSPGTYDPVRVPYLNGTLTNSELSGVVQLCNFIQANGTGFGICKSCRLGALGGAKQ